MPTQQEYLHQTSHKLIVCTLVPNRGRSNPLNEDVAVRRLQVCVVVLKVLDVLEAVFLVELERLLVVALHVKRHLFDFSRLHAVFDSLLEQLGSDAVTTVRFQYCDGHDIADARSVFLDVLLARDCANEDIFDISKFGIPLHCFEHVVKVLRVDHR